MGVNRLRGVHMSPMFICPYTFGHPIHLDTPICSEFNRAFISYKMFLTLEAGMGGLSDLGGVHMPHVHIPCTFVHPHLFTEF